MKAVRSFLSFDGKGSHVLVEKKPAHRVAREITLEAWVFVVEHGPEWTGIVSKVHDTGDTESGYGLLLDGDGGAYLALKPSSGETYQYWSSGSGSLPVNEWHHVAGTYDGKQATLYIDGEKKATYNIEIAGIHYDPENELYIGTNRDDDEDLPFHGKIGEVSVWSAARPQDQIKKDMTGTLRGDEPDLVAYLPLDEGQGDTGKDASPTKGPGKIVGASWEKAEVPFGKVEPEKPAGGKEQGAGGSGKLTGVLDTSAALAATLERLNRRSVTDLIQQIVQEMDEHCRTFDGKVAEEISKLRKELMLILDGLRKTTDEHQGEINGLHKAILDLEKLVQKFTTEINANIGNIVNAKIDLRLPDILKNISVNLKTTIEQLIGDKLGEIDVDGLLKKIEELKVKLDLVKKSAEELDAGELEQVEELLKGLLLNIDLGDVLAKIKIQINGSSFGLVELLDLLAGAPKVQAIHFTYDLSDITGARFVLVDNTEVTFVAARTEDPAKGEVTYQFETANWRGLPASFTLRFKKTTQKMQLCKKTVALDTYDAVYQSNVVFRLAA